MEEAKRNSGHNNLHNLPDKTTRGMNILLDEKATLSKVQETWPKV